MEVKQNCGAQFNPNNFVEELWKVQHGFMKSWEESLETWLNINHEHTVRKLQRMLTTLSEMLDQSQKKFGEKKKGTNGSNLPPLRAASLPLSSATEPTPPRAPKKRLMNDAIVVGEAAPKKKKQQRAPPTNASQRSTLTTTIKVLPKTKKDKTKVTANNEDFVKLAALKMSFDANFKSSFYFDREAKKVQISQLARGKYTWIVCGLERDIIDSLKGSLARLGDIRHRQTIVVTPIDNE